MYTLSKMAPALVARQSREVKMAANKWQSGKGSNHWKTNGFSVYLTLTHLWLEKEKKYKMNKRNVWLKALPPVLTQPMNTFAHTKNRKALLESKILFNQLSGEL